MEPFNQSTPNPPTPTPHPPPPKKRKKRKKKLKIHPEIKRLVFQKMVISNSKKISYIFSKESFSNIFLKKFRHTFLFRPAKSCSKKILIFSLKKIDFLENGTSKNPYILGSRMLLYFGERYNQNLSITKTMRFFEPWHV